MTPVTHAHSCHAGNVKLIYFNVKMVENWKEWLETKCNSSKRVLPGLHRLDE